MYMREKLVQNLRRRKHYRSAKHSLIDGNQTPCQKRHIFFITICYSKLAEAVQCSGDSADSREIACSKANFPNTMLLLFCNPKMVPNLELN